MDPFSIDVDASAVRSVLVRHALKKFPNVRNSLNISVNPVKLKRRQGGAVTPKAVPRGGSGVELPRDLKAALNRPGFLEYSPATSTAAREKRKKVREELGERNPYCWPCEGLRHSYRSVVKSLGHLDGSRGPGRALKRRAKVHEIVTKVYADTTPVVKPSVAKEAFRVTFDNTSVSEHKEAWKEIERCRVYTKLRYDQSTDIAVRLERERQVFEDRSALWEQEATALERDRLEEDRSVVEYQQLLVAEKESSRTKLVTIEALCNDLALFLRRLDRHLQRFNELQTYEWLLFAMSPYEWQQTHTTSKPMLPPPDTGPVVMNPAEEYLVRASRLSSAFLESHGKCCIYFESPQQLLAYFDELEKRIFTMYNHARLAGQLGAAVAEQLTSVKRCCELEIAVLTSMKSPLVEAIQEEENKIESLKRFCSQYLAGDFAKIVMELEAVRELLESCYTSCVPKAVNITEVGAGHLMKKLEWMTNTLIEASNPSDPETMRITLQFSLEDRRPEVNPQRTIRECEYLLKGLVRAFDDTRVAHYRKPMRRSVPPREKSELTKQSDQLTAAQRDHIYFFEDSGFII